MALAATGTEFASAATPDIATGQYHVEAKVVSLPATAAKDISSNDLNSYYPDDIFAHVVGNPKAKVVSLPSADAAETLPSNLALTHEMALAGGKSRQIGVSLMVSPVLHGPDFGSATLEFKNVRVVGFSDIHGNHPIFSTQHITTSVMLFHDVQPGYYCLSLPAMSKLSKTYDANGRLMASVADANERQLLFVKITRG